MYKYYPFGKRRKLKILLRRECIFRHIAFEESFKLYNSNNHPFFLESYNFFKACIVPGMKVLDVGCKHGHISSLIAANKVNVTGIDHDEEAIATAKKKYPITNLKFVHEEANNFLNSSCEKYDLIILSNILEHMDSPADFLIKLRPFASLIYIDLPDFEASYLNFFRQDLNDSLIYEDNDHIYEFSRKEFTDIINETGYIVEHSLYKYGFQKYIIRKSDK